MVRIPAELGVVLARRRRARREPVKTHPPRAARGAPRCGTRPFKTTLPSLPSIRLKRSLMPAVECHAISLCGAISLIRWEMESLMADSVAKFVHVSKRYPGGIFGRPILALDDVTLQLPRGEVVGLVGPNRAGKSTLIKLLLTICRPTSGEIVRLGSPWHDRRSLARVGYIHESQSLPRYVTARDVLEYYGALTGLSSLTARRRTEDLLERVGLADRSREPIARFSKGMLQRLALAQALLNQPELLVFDEPTEGMDLIARRLVYEAIADQRIAGRSVLLVSHALADVEKHCDRVAVLREGRLRFFGPTAELSHRGGESLEDALEPLYCEDGELVSV